MFHPTETRTRLTTCKYDGSYRSWSHETQRGDTLNIACTTSVPENIVHILQAEIITTCLLFLTFIVSLIWFDDIIGELPLPFYTFSSFGILAHTHSAWVCWLNHPNSSVLSNTFNVSEREGTLHVTRVTVTDVSRVTRRSNCYFVTHSIHNAEPRPDTCKWAI